MVALDGFVFVFEYPHINLEMVHTKERLVKLWNMSFLMQRLKIIKEIITAITRKLWNRKTTL